MTFFPSFSILTLMKPITQMPREVARGVRYVLTDIDDTMTRDGFLVPAAYAALVALADAGLPVIAVTGRSAGWGEVHLQEWPIDAVIAENGAIAYYRRARGETSAAGVSGPFGALVDPSAAENTAPALLRAAKAAYGAVSRALPASDNHFRKYDYAIDHAEYVSPPLSADEVSRIVGIFEREGCRAKPSSIHINCWIGDFDKRAASVALLRARYGYDDERDRSSVLYVGDALNDEVMFAHFPNSCAVANVDRWLDRMASRPSWVSSARYGEGFSEIARGVLSLRE